MKIDQAKSIVKSVLPPKRYDHSLRVADVAIKLAGIYNVCRDNIYLAAVLHDYAKFRPEAEMRRWINYSKLPKDLLLYNHVIWHGPVGALMLQYEQGIDNQEVLTAIRYHTTGRPHMELIEQILFVADYIEPARDFPGLEEIRNMAFKDINQTTLLVLRNMIRFLITKGQDVYPDTFNAYNEFNQSNK